MHVAVNKRITIEFTLFLKEYFFLTCDVLLILLYRFLGMAKRLKSLNSDSNALDKCLQIRGCMRKHCAQTTHI